MSALAGSAGAVTVRDWPGGLRWIHRPVGHNQIFAFHLVIPGGAGDETEAQAGITRLMASAMIKGTQTRDALRLAQEMELLGASFGLDAHPDFISVGGQVIADRWNPMVDLFQDILLNPVFPPAEVEKERASLLNDLHTRHERIFNVAEERLRREIFGRHPYGRPDEGIEASVAGLTPEDLRAWHGRRVSPRGAVLVTVGPVSEKALADRIESLAAAWRAADAEAPTRRPVEFPSEGVRVEERRDFEQGYVMTGFPAPSVDDPRYAAVKVFNAMLGGGMSSPLFRRVREEGSLAYEVSSFYPSRLAGSAFVVYAGVGPANVDLAERKIGEVLREFAAGPISPEEVADAQAYIRGHYLMDHQTNGRIAWYLAWWEILGKGHAHDAQYPRDIAEVSADDIHAVARDILARPSVTVRVLPRAVSPR